MLPLLLLLGIGAVVVAVANQKPTPKPPPAQGLPPLYPMPNPEVPLPPIPGVPPQAGGMAAFLANFGTGHMFALQSPFAPGLTLLLAVTATANPDDMALIAQAAATVPGTVASDLGLTAGWYAAQKNAGHTIYFQVDPSSQFAHVSVDVPIPGYLQA